MRATYSIIIFCLVSVIGQAQGYFIISDDVKEAYNAVIDLRMDEARLKIQELKQNEPQNLMTLLVENYLDFFTIFINENKKEFKRLERNKKYRLKQIEKGDKSSPFYLFVISEINLQWALARLKFGQRLKAGSEVYSAYSALEENLERFPDFIHNKKSLSILHAVSESVPGFLRRIIGVRGSIELGTEEIADVVAYSENNEFLFSTEAVAIYAYILYYQNNRKTEALDLVKSSELDPSKSPLACFLIASMAQKNGDNELAIKTLNARPQGPEYFPFHYLDLMLGKSKLYKLEEGADIPIKRFIQNFKGEHFIKEAYQKLAWYELVVNEDIAAYKGYISRCKSEGHSLVDEDKQAEKEAKNNIVPHSDLLAARLLYDGGYYQRAYNLLIRKAYFFVEAGANHLEYSYRLGRITQALKNYPDAIQYYSETIEKGNESDSYYACNSALQLGLILEEQDRFKEAKRFLNICLDMSPKTYKSSLHQKAKTALERVENKGI